MILYILIGLSALVLAGVIVWFLQPAKVKPEEPFSSEPDYPVKELLELIIRDGELDRKYRVIFFLFNSQVSCVTRGDYSDIEWLIEDEINWLYDQLDYHLKQQEELERKKERKEAGEWIKQELGGATDRAKSCLRNIQDSFHYSSFAPYLNQKESR